MSTTTLLSYQTGDSLQQIPSYTSEPQVHEQRLALSGRFPRPSGNFVKESKNGNARLRLMAQEDDAVLPLYSSGAPVDGVIELSKTEGVSRVEVKLEGHLKLREIAEGGHSTARLCLDTRVLWIKDRENRICPDTLRFSLQIPDTFTFEEKTYPLPPTFGVKLSGLPGFTANIDYSVGAIINRPNASGPVKSKAIGLIVGTQTVATPILYYPRTHPPSPLPHPLVTTSRGFLETPEWGVHESVLYARQKGINDITVKLYIPVSRVFCISERIPFHLSISSNPISLAAFLPLSPTTHVVGRPKAMRLQLMRQSTVDVRSVVKADANREMWRVDNIGEATFRLIGDAPTWIAYSGEIHIDTSVRTAGFKAAGLSVKDCLLLSLNPFDPYKCPFSDLRQVLNVRLTTDLRSPNAADRLPSPPYVPRPQETGSRA
ncbi:hypothetical protein FA15DRAFT_383944 [Coprinopsis marcescibilis]|uniref:Arrestin-like N-terminal domain-containing protein n=1 Tax=Coprinopsis marcescibilis TaxID=230819 RepID=A0A5C3KX36_COPMA|nr:hypothetical protein FA15DRAFT_383944 [Coprinopsis marcescibilis]